MKWVNVNKGSSNETFELWAADKKLADVSFSRHTKFARMVSQFGKRIFSFEDKGLFSTRKFIRNEYGIKMGKLEEIKPGAGKGYVEMDGKKYFFIYNPDNSGELTLYDESMQKNLLTCSFNAIVEHLNKTKSLLDGKFSSLLLVLCWYTFQPHTSLSKETVA
jgi:hypothetical protein